MPALESSTLSASAIKLISCSKLQFQYLIQLPNNNLQFKKMHSLQSDGLQRIQNRGFSPPTQLDIEEFKKQYFSLILKIENALKLNKQLILNFLFQNYIKAINSPLINLSPETHQTLKNNVQQFNEKMHQKRRNQFLRSKLRIKKKRESYDTKNIPKNFGTAIHIFIKKNSAKVKMLLSKKKISYSQFYQFNKDAKEKINSLLHLRELWEKKQGDGEARLKECYRIISFEFMRKHCLNYIFGSRIKNTSSHIRYRKKLLEGIERPHTLFNLKDY